MNSKNNNIDIHELLEKTGIDPNKKINYDLNNIDENAKDWKTYTFRRRNNSISPFPILLIESGPKKISDVKKITKKMGKYLIMVLKINNLYTLFLKSDKLSKTIQIDNITIFNQVISLLNTQKFDGGEMGMMVAIETAIRTAPSATSDFINKGIFSTHYILNRMLNDIKKRNIEIEASKINIKIFDIEKTLNSLGYEFQKESDLYTVKTKYDRLVVVTTDNEDMNIQKSSKNTIPSYRAISELDRYPWVILTNGIQWRLYSNKLSATTTNYFEINLKNASSTAIQYFVAIFGANAHIIKNGKTDLENIYDLSKIYAEELEKDLATKIQQEGLFLDLVKGIIDHDFDTNYSHTELHAARNNALKLMYRIWFLLYAESRNLLPVADERYRIISLENLRTKFDNMDETPDAVDCWDELLILFNAIRNGSPEHNLPQYAGNLFEFNPYLDELKIKNKFIVKALQGLFEKDGNPMDYSTLGVRHLGNVYESLIEFTVNQAKKDIILIEDNKGTHEIKSKINSSYSYKKNDLYLASKGNTASRKTSASYFTPAKFVELLVKRGLEPILSKRKNTILPNLKKYKMDSTKSNYKKCVDDLLDIQILDPSMGSGHFLVESLNQLTRWATNIINTYPDHPVMKEVLNERDLVLKTHKNNNITIDSNFLTLDVLLKRKIMKRCIFGVDYNPLAVELTKLSLWLDSFAIGMPLTYLDHHIKTGDSTIGMWLNDRDENVLDQRLDNWMGDAYSAGDMLNAVSMPADVTIAELRSSEQHYKEFEVNVRPHKIVLDVLAAKLIDKSIAKNSPKDLTSIFQKAKGKKILDSEKRYDGVLKKTSALSKKLKFFHWELEMMDAFIDKRKGFDVIITNPPWDKVRPNTNEFYGQYVLGYKNTSSEIKKLTHKKYSKEYENYVKTINEKRTYWHNRGGIGENRDYELYRLILERILELLAPGGVFSILIPSAILNSRSSAALRKHVLKHKILSINGFANKYKIFPIHTSNRFVLLTVQNIKSNDDFSAMFYLYNLDEINNFERTLQFSGDLMETLSSDISIICELKNKRDLEIFNKLFSMHPKLIEMDGWQVDLGRELDICGKKDKELLIKNTDGWPVIESKNFHQYIPEFSNYTNYVNVKDTLDRTETIKKFHGKNIAIHENIRLVYRKVSSSTNTRTMISCILPPHVFTTLATFMALPKINEFHLDSNYYKLNAYLCGIFNSMTYDYLIRAKVDKNVETYHIYDTPVPKNFTDLIATQIIKLVASLTLSNNWNDAFASQIGVAKESFTLNKRINMTAKIDALVAIHYGLDRDEYIHILEYFEFNGDFDQSTLKQDLCWADIPKGERDKNMKKFFNTVKKKCLFHYDKINSEMKKNV